MSQQQHVGTILYTLGPLLIQEQNALLAPIGRHWQKILVEQPDIDLFHKDGEHAGPYGDFLIAAVLCRLLAGDVSDAVSGMGFDFVQGMTIDMERPLMVEDKAALPVQLDKDKTDRILSIVKA